MAGSKESGLALTPLLARSSSRNDTDGSAASPSVPSISFLPARSSSKNLQGLERESTENATVSLHQAARDGKLELVKRRLEQLGRNNKKINKRDQDNTTALHYAVRYGHMHTVQLLLEYGADIQAKGEDDASPLHYAARYTSMSKSLAITPRLTPQVSPAPSTENLTVNDAGVTSKKEEQKRDAETSRSLSKATKDRLLGSLTKRKESLGMKMFKELQIGKNLATLQRTLSGESMIMFLLSQKAAVNARDSYGSTPLHYAVARGNPAAVSELLTQPGIDIEAKDKTQMTPLHTAASHGSAPVAKHLIKAGAKLRSLDEEQMTPLHFACMEGKLEVAQLLFESAEEEGGWSVVSKMVIDQDREEETGLHLAVEGGYPGVAKLCLDKGANVNAVRINMSTPLHLAATGGDLDIVAMLVDHDANIEAKNILQETPLHRAALFNRVETVEFLLKRKAQIECRDKDKDTPLLIAASKNHLATVRCLLSHGADVGAKDINDCTPIFRSASEGCIETLQHLLEHQRDKALLEECDKYENTPLHIAAKKGYVRIVQLLLTEDCCIDSKNDAALTPLHLAAQFGRRRTVCALLKRDPTIINDEDDASNTALHLAAFYGHDRVVKELLHSGAAIDARNANLWTPLDCAAARGWVETATVLLDGDSPVDPTDKAKTTPLHLASREGHVEMVKLLLSRKANITLTDSSGRNCLDMAIDNSHKDVALCIINHEDWKQVMRHKTKEGGNITTPMRKLIKKLPEVAEQVFNRCFTSNGLPVDNPKYAITMEYEFLDDVNLEWAGFTEGREMDGHGVDAVMSMIRAALPENAQKQLQIKSSHPLMLMVRKERVKLLSHPLVTYLLRYKWRRFGRMVYYSRLVLYILFLFFLTGYAMVTATDVSTSQCRQDVCVCNVTFEGEPTGSEILWRTVGRPVVLTTTSISLFLELLQLCYLWRFYLQWDRLVEVLAYLFSLLYVVDDYKSNGTSFEIESGSRCHVWHNSLGAAAVYLAWTGLVLFMRKFPKLGIYVVMFTDILQTFAQFFLVFFLFVIAFGLGFHILIHDQVPFSTPGRSMLKTAMGMLGEYEYDTVYNDNDVPSLTWALYVLFLVINCIIIMNLLVGLAVDDIKGVQEKAVLKRLAMQVNLVLDVEKALPAIFRRRFAITQEVVLPNANNYFTIWSFWSSLSPGRAIHEAMNREQTPLERLQQQQDQLKDEVLQLKGKLKHVLDHTTHLEAMMKAVLKHHDISVEEEEEGEDED